MPKRRTQSSPNKNNANSIASEIARSEGGAHQAAILPPPVQLKSNTNKQEQLQEHESHEPVTDSYLFAIGTNEPPDDSSIEKENGGIGQFYIQRKEKPSHFSLPTQTENLNNQPVRFPLAIQKKSVSGNLPDEVRGKMEVAFGTDFSEINIHSNSQSAVDLGALAYTQGNDIHFAPGQYKLDTQSGQELLGHELTHVIQQKEGRVQPNIRAAGMLVNDDVALEREADLMGKNIASLDNVTQSEISFNPKSDFHVIQGKFLLPTLSGVGISSLISSWRDTHYNRNNRNKVPENEPVNDSSWRRLPNSESIYHQNGETGRNNRKYVSTDGGHYEAVYDENGTLVTDAANLGTYNFSGPSNKVGHFMDDVLPYWIWGNSLDDDTPPINRILGPRIKERIEQNIKKTFQVANLVGELAEVTSKLGVKVIGKGAMNIADTAIRSIGRIGDSILEGTSEVGNGILDGMASTAGGSSDGISYITSSIGSGFQSLGNGMLEGFQQLGNGTSSGIDDILDGNIIDGFNDIGSGILRGGSSLSSGTLDGVSNVGNGISDGLSSVGNGIWDGIGEIGGGMVNGLSSVSSAILGEGERAVNSVGETWNSGKAFYNSIQENGLFNALERTALDAIYAEDQGSSLTSTSINLGELSEQFAFDEFMTDAAYYGKGEEKEGLSNELEGRSQSERDRMTSNDYNPNSFRTVEGTDGFQLVFVLPTQGSNQEPYLSVRGSEADEDVSNDWGTDFDSEEVGHTQYQNNRELINKVLKYLVQNSSTGRIEISGHSLGGALAQKITAENPAVISRLTTFQAPGLSQESYNTYRRNVDQMDPGVDAPNIAHHIASRDIVHLAGETNLPGNYYVHESGDWLNNPQRSRSNPKSTVVPHTETLVDDDNDQILNQNHKVTLYEQYPFPAGREFAEGLRQDLGGDLQDLFEAYYEYKYN